MGNHIALFTIKKSVVLEQVSNKLLTTCNELSLQQDWYSIYYSLVLSTLLQSCCNKSVSELIGQPCNKSDVPVKLVTSCS